MTVAAAGRTREVEDSLQRIVNWKPDFCLV
jgi:hypothetical protein